MLQIREFGFQFFPIGFDKDCTVGEDDGGDTSVAVVDLYYEFGGFLIFFQSNVDKGDIIQFKESFGAQAIRAIAGRVHHDL